MGTVLIRGVGILQERYPLTHRLADVKVIKVTDEDDVALGEAGIIRAFGQLTAVNAALVKPDPPGQIILTVCLNFYVEDGTLIIFQVHIKADAVIIIAIGEIFLPVKKLDPLNFYAQQLLQKYLHISSERMTCPNIKSDFNGSSLSGVMVYCFGIG